MLFGARFAIFFREANGDWVLYTLHVEVVQDQRRTLAYAASSHLARADVELGLVDRAPGF